MTSIYGIRKYTNNSILRMHVDTLATHVVSAIINVDQDVVTPWKLLILDHNDEEHELEMQPGDMVLYESAKLLHGRPGIIFYFFKINLINSYMCSTNEWTSL